MDTGTFMNEQTGGGGGGLTEWIGKLEGVTVAKITPQHLMHAQFQMYHGIKLVARAVFVFMVIFVIMYFIKLGPCIQGMLTNGWRSNTDAFTQRERMLPYLGGIANSLRSDLQIEGDTLAEMAMKNNTRVTDTSPPPAAAKAGFRSRERLAPTPEEEAMRKMSA